MATVQSQAASSQVQTAGAAAVKTAATRLTAYGLAEADAFPDSLVVPEGKTLTLSAPAAGQKKAGYVTLRPKTIDDVKRWIGVPDSVGKRRTFPPLQTSRLAFVGGQAAGATLSKAQRVSLKDLADQYVNGDSSSLTHYSASISQILNKAFVNGVFLLQDVDVLPNAELKLAANLKVFTANNIRIWKGGRIRILGHMKVDCASIVGNYTAPKIPLVIESSLILGVLSNFGG